MARLAIFIPDMRGGGAERVALSLIEGFLDRGHEVDLVLLRAAGELMGLLPAKARVVELKVDRIRRSIGPLASYLKRQQPDALLAMMWPLTVVAVLARMLARSTARIAVSDHGILSSHFAGKPAIMSGLRLSTKLFYPRADSRIASSEAIAADLGRLSGLERGSFRVIHNPVLVPPGPIATDEEAQSLWAGADARILAVGALKPEKNYRLLIEAFAALPNKRSARLAIIGEGQLRPELEALSARLGVADRVLLPGYRANPWPFYASADLFVLSSRSEGFGNVLVEAMAAGLPIVSTDCGGPREILGDSKWGTLVPVGDRDSLARAMERALDATIDRDGLKARAGQFGPDRAVDAYIELLVPACSPGTA